MKLTTLLTLLATATASVSAAAIPGPEASPKDLLANAKQNGVGPQPTPTANLIRDFFGAKRGVEGRDFPIYGESSEDQAKETRWTHRAGRDIEADDKAVDSIKRQEVGYCHRQGEPCWKVKRAAEAFAEALAEPDAESDPTRWCHRVGEPCWKAKRDLELLKKTHEEWKAI